MKQKFRGMSGNSLYFVSGVDSALANVVSLVLFQPRQSAPLLANIGVWQS